MEYVARKLKDLTGTVHGKWTVLKRGPNHPDNNKVMYECLCRCGFKALVNAQSLREGTSRSCGCSRFEYAKLNKETLNGME